MGCAQSRVILEEENAIIKAEEALRFQFAETRTLDSTFRAHSFENRVNELQLAKASKILDVCLSNTGPHTRISAFLNKLKQFEQDYLLEDWLAISVLLGRGSGSFKASVLFHVFSEGESSINMAEMKGKLLKKLSYISLTLGNLVSNQQGYGSNEMKNLNYIERISQVQTMAINKVAERMAIKGMNIDEQTFVEVIKNFRRGSLLTATGWRTYMHEIQLLNPSKQAWANPYSKSEEQT